MWRKITRWLSGIFFAGIIGILILALVLFLVVDTKKMTAFAEKIVAEQTGGKLAIGKMDFSAFRGFTLKDIQFTPPSADGSPNSSGQKLMSVQELRLHWNLWSVLYGSVTLDAALINGGEIYLSQINGNWNFGGIMAYRQKIFSEPLPTPAKPPEPAAVGKLIETISSSFFVPIRVSVSNVGVRNLNIHVSSDQKTEENLDIKGLTTTIDLRAFGRNASLAIASEVKRLTKGPLDLENLTSKIEATIKAVPSEKKISLTSLKIKLLETMTNEIKASVAATTASPDILVYELEEKLRISAAIPPSLKKLLPPDLNIDGEITLEIAKTSGELNLKTLNQDITAQKLGKLLPAHLKTVFALKNIAVTSQALGIETKPLNLTMRLDTNTIGDDSVKVGLKLDTALEAASYTDLASPDKTNLKVDQLGLTLNASAELPTKPAIETDLNLSIAAVGIQSQTIDYVGVPIKLSGKVKTENLLDKASAEFSIISGDLFSANAGITCGNACQDFKLAAKSRIPSFANLWALTKTNIARRVQPRFQPETISGAVELSADIQGHAANVLKTTPKDLLKKLTWNSDLKVALTGLGVKIPFNNLSLEDANIGFSLRGDHKKQSLTVAESFKSLVANLPSKNKIPPKLELSTFSWQTTANSTIPPLSQLNQAAHLVRSNVRTKMSLGSVNVTQLLKKPLTSIEVSAAASTHKNLSFALDEFTALIPDLKTSIGLSAAITLARDFAPESFRVRLDADLREMPTEYLKAIKASGSLSVNLAVASEDMEFGEIRGLAGIRNLNLTIPGAEANKPALLQITDMNGKIPIQHKFALGMLKSSKSDGSETKKTDMAKDDLIFSGVVDVNDDQIKDSAEQYLQKIKPPIFGDTRIAVSEDFSSFSEFYPDRQPITIQKITAAGLALEHLEIDAELAQNELSINNFVTGFIGGKIQGDLQLAFDDKPVSVKTSLHVTRLNTEYLVRDMPGLKRKARGLFGGSNPYLDGAVHLQYDLRSGDMLGGVDITSIGKDQLRMIMYYIDPTDSDSSISAIKTALNFGEVKLVSIPIKNGEIGVDVDVRLLATPIPTPKIQGFPIAKLISNFKNQDESTNESSH